MTNLSILIPARNEIFLAKTVENILENIQGNTEILVGLDGAWANPPVKNDPRVTIIYRNESIGQRAMTNDLCKIAKGKYVMKIDAHCAVDEGFDVKMVEAFKETGDNVTMIPALYNLHAFNWKCKKCGNEWYQSPTPTRCQLPGEAKGDNPNCDNTTDFEKVIYWRPRESRRSEAYRFDTTLHFQYHRDWQKKVNGDFVETMSAQGSCFMLTKEKYWELNICDEEFGSWGQQGVEVACKTWLSGGRLLTNRRTWYAHMFRTQGGDFGCPFPLSGNQVDKARKYSRELFLNNTWEGQIKPLSWLIEKFAPLPDWHKPENKDILDKVMKAGEEFYKKKGIVNREPQPTKGIIYYTDNQLNLKIAHRVQKNLKEIGLPIVSASLKPMPHFGKNIHVKLKRGYLTMFKQILAALEASTADIIFFCEHDVWYSPTHFDFIPPDKETFYYNINVWRVRVNDGHALKTKDCKQLSGLCGYRDALLTHFRERCELAEQKYNELVGKDGDETEFNRWIRYVGFEPMTHNRIRWKNQFKCESWESEQPNLDLKHGNNATGERWKKEQYRNQKWTEGWTESEKNIPGWGDIGYIINSMV